MHGFVVLLDRIAGIKGNHHAGFRRINCQSHVSLQRFRVLLLPSKESSKTKNDNIAICGGRNHPNWAIGKRNTVSRRSHPMDQGGGTLCNWCIRRTDFIQKESKEIPVILQVNCIYLYVDMNEFLQNQYFDMDCQLATRYCIKGCKMSSFALLELSCLHNIVYIIFGIIDKNF